MHRHEQGNQIHRRGGIWEQQELDKTSSPVRLNPRNVMLKMKEDQAQQALRDRDKSRNKEDRRTTFNFGFFGSKADQGTAKSSEKPSPSFEVKSKLEDASKKQSKPINENVKEKNFWSKQFSKYATELDHVMGKTKEDSLEVTEKTVNKRCFEAIVHCTKLQEHLSTFLAVSENKYVIFMFTERVESEIQSTIRLYSIERMNRAKQKELEKIENLKKETSPTIGSMDERPKQVFADNITPMIDYTFLGFFKNHIENNENRAFAKKAILAETTMKGKGICNFTMTSNQKILAVVFHDSTKLDLIVKIYSLPKLQLVMSSVPLVENISKSNIFKPFFSYNNRFGSELLPDYLYIPVKGVIYSMSMAIEDDEGKAIATDVPRELESTNGLIENSMRLMQISKMHGRDLIMGKLFEAKNESVYGLWSWNRKTGRGYTQISDIKLTISHKYTIINDSVSPDHKFVFGYVESGKEVVRIGLRSSFVKTVYRYMVDNRTIHFALLADSGRYLIIADSANEVRVLRQSGKSYQTLYCQYMIEPIMNMVLSKNQKYLIVMTESKIFSIRVQLSQRITFEVIGRKPSLKRIDGLHFGKVDRTIRFENDLFTKITLVRESSEGLSLNTYRTGFHVHQSINHVRIPDSDRFLVWNNNKIWTLDMPGLCYGQLGVSYYRQEKTLEEEDLVSALELTTYQDAEVRILQISFNLDYKYVFVHLGSTEGKTRTVEAWSLFSRQNLFNITEIEYMYCIVNSSALVLRWKPEDISTAEYGFYENGEFTFEHIQVQKIKECRVLDVKVYSKDGEINKVLFITLKRLYILDVPTMTMVYRAFPNIVENLDSLVSPCGKILAINEKNYRNILFYTLEANSFDYYDSGFEIKGTFVETLRMCFTHDSEYLVTLDEEYVIKVISLKLKREVSQFMIRDFFPVTSLELCYMEFSDFSHSLMCCFQSDRSVADEGIVVAKIPFYGTRYSPLNTILGYYIQRYFYTSNLLEKSSLCKGIVAIIHSYHHYQVAINSILTGTILLINAPGLIEQYCDGFIDFNILCTHGLLKYSMEKNKFYSLISYNSMFGSYAAKTRETPYIDEEQIETLSKLESTAMNNRYSRAVLSQVVFSPIRVEYGELKTEGNNVIPLPLNYKQNELEETISKLMKPDYSSLNKYHCYVTKMPLDLSIGSDFSIAFFSNIKNYSEEEIQSKYKVFIYYKWNQVYYFALAHSLIYWLLNVCVFLYFGKYVDTLWIAIVIIALNFLFLLYEMKGLLTSRRYYFRDGWNNLDILNHLLCLATAVVCVSIEEDKKYIWANVMRFVSSLAISIRGISMLVVFKHVRYITTMYFQVLSDMWSFLVVLAYVIFLSTQAWSIEPQMESDEFPEYSFLEALNVVINTAMGNFNTEIEEGRSMTSAQLVLIILVNVVTGLALLNFLISLISETYQRISEKRDYYDVLELLPIIQEIDMLFKDRRMTLDIEESSKKSSGRVDEKSESQKSHTSNPSSARFSQKDYEIAKLPSLNPNLPKASSTSSSLRKFMNARKLHYLCLIPDIEQSDTIKELKQTIQSTVKEANQNISQSNADLSSKQNKLKTSIKELQLNQIELKGMIQVVLKSQEHLQKQIDSVLRPRNFNSSTSIPNEFDEEDKSSMALMDRLNLTQTAMKRGLEEEEDSIHSDGMSGDEGDNGIHTDLING